MGYVSFRVPNPDASGSGRGICLAFSRARKKADSSGRPIPRLRDANPRNDSPGTFFSTMLSIANLGLAFLAELFNPAASAAGNDVNHPSP